MRFTLVLLCASISVSAAAATEPREQAYATCTAYQSVQRAARVDFCIQRSRPDLPPAKGEPVIYYMHGIWTDHRNWMLNGFDVALDLLRKSERLPPMTFVAFNTSLMSMFSDHSDNPRARDSYESWFLNEFIPYIEDTYDVCRRRECRGLMGHSMGGLGALKTALRHPELFFLGMASAPALVPYNVFEPMEIWDAYFDRHPIGRTKGRFLVTSARSTFRTPENFDDNNPIHIFQQVRADLWPVLHIEVGGKDSYGFQEGTALFVDALEAQGADFTYYFDPNGSHQMVRGRTSALLRLVRDRLAASLDQAAARF